MSSAGPQLSEFSVTALERKLDIKLPPDYRRFLMEYNGGDPTPGYFSIPGEIPGGSVRVVQNFFGVKKLENASNLEWAFNTFRNDLPNNIIPVASTGYEDDAVCISTSGADTGKVYFWNSQGAGRLGSYDELHLLADTFQEFLDSLYEYISPDESEVDRIIRENDMVGLHSLLKSGYDIEARDKYDCTIIDNATINKRVEMIKILIDKGAKTSNALEIARRNLKLFDGYKPVVELLEKVP